MPNELQRCRGCGRDRPEGDFEGGLCWSCRLRCGSRSLRTLQDDDRARLVDVFLDAAPGQASVTFIHRPCEPHIRQLEHYAIRLEVRPKGWAEEVYEMEQQYLPIEKGRRVKLLERTILRLFALMREKGIDL